MFDIMGYDTRDPFEVNPEYNADFGTKHKEKVDYAICINDKPIMLVEAKPFDMSLSIKHCSQLFRYFSVSEARIGILTNGLKYQFFSDIDNENKMDDVPFFEFDLEEKLTDAQISQLKKFRKEEFDVEKIIPTAKKLKSANELYDKIAAEMQNPSDELVKYFAKDIHKGVFNKNALDKYRPLITSVFNDIKRDAIEESLKKMQQTINNEKASTVKESEDENDVVTTEEEYMGLTIVKSICSKIVTVDRIVMRDAKSYCAILFDDNNRKPVCNLYFNSQTKKYIEIPDETGKRIKYPLSDVFGIQQFEEKIIYTVQRYLKK